MCVNDERVCFFLHLDAVARLGENCDGYLQHHTLTAAAIAGIGSGHKTLRYAAPFAASLPEENQARACALRRHLHCGSAAGPGTLGTRRTTTRCLLLVYRRQARPTCLQ